MTTGTDLEIAAVAWTDRVRRDVDALATRIRTVCPEGSRVRTADELRGMERSLVALAGFVADQALKLEDNHAG
jgi:hypothetical protein